MAVHVAHWLRTELTEGLPVYLLKYWSHFASCMLQPCLVYYWHLHIFWLEVRPIHSRQLNPAAGLKPGALAPAMSINICCTVMDLIGPSPVAGCTWMVTSSGRFSIQIG